MKENLSQKQNNNQQQRPIVFWPLKLCIRFWAAAKISAGQRINCVRASSTCVCVCVWSCSDWAKTGPFCAEKRDCHYLPARLHIILDDKNQHLKIYKCKLCYRPDELCDVTMRRKTFSFLFIRIKLQFYNRTLGNLFPFLSLFSCSLCICIRPWPHVPHTHTRTRTSAIHSR